MTAETFEIAADLTRLGAVISDLEDRRREFMKKSPRILDYKADLIKRIEYSLDGELATVHIPWDDIREYSDEYNPNVLILEEMRLVEGVKVAVAVGILVEVATRKRQDLEHTIPLTKKWCEI